jgi:hypothetical protein
LTTALLIDLLNAVDPEGHREVHIAYEGVRGPIKEVRDMGEDGVYISEG